MCKKPVFLNCGNIWDLGTIVNYTCVSLKTQMQGAAKKHKFMKNLTSLSKDLHNNINPLNTAQNRDNKMWYECQ